MAHTYSSLNYHIIFSTKHRQPWLTAAIRQRLWPYLAAMARGNRMGAIEVGGVSDHVHALITIPPTIAVAKAVHLVKGTSSRWIKTEFPNTMVFAWQDGYGAFSVSESQLGSVRDYIRSQPNHHRTKSFADEYHMFLERHHLAI